jgi:hypothetical protein
MRVCPLNVDSNRERLRICTSYFADRSVRDLPLPCTAVSGGVKNASNRSLTISHGPLPLPERTTLLKAIQALDKQTFAFEAIKGFSALTNISAKAKLALIEISATETLKELAPEIESIKNDTGTDGE